MGWRDCTGLCGCGNGGIVAVWPGVDVPEA